MGLFFLLLVAGAVLWLPYELFEHRCVRCSKTRLHAKLPGDRRRLRLCVISDLHNNRQADNDRLFRRIAAYRPEAFLLCGDMVNKHRDDNAQALRFLTRLCRIAPVFYSMGNHESELARRNPAAWASYVKRLPNGCLLLDNRTVSLGTVLPGATKIRISGLTLPLSYYKKGKLFEQPFVPEHLGTPGGYHILLAHHPEYVRQYAPLHADLVISGHLHGGLLRLPLVGGVISPRFRVPKYDAGLYRAAGQRLFVSRGLGSHSIPLRFFNRVEVNFLTITA